MDRGAKKQKILFSSLVGIFACVLMIIAISVVSEIMGPGHRAQFFLRPALSIVSAMMATFVVVFWYDGFIKQHVESDLAHLIRVNVDQVFAEQNNIRAHGIKGVYKEFKNELFAKHADDAAEIQILQTYAPNMRDLLNVIEAAIARGSKVKIALLNPNSKFVDIRYPEVDATKEVFVSGIRSNLSDLRKLAQNAKGGRNIAIRLYDRSPGVSIYATEKVIIVGNYLSQTNAISAPQIEIGEDSPLFKTYTAHFDRLWREGEVVPAIPN